MRRCLSGVVDGFAVVDDYLDDGDWVNTRWGVSCFSVFIFFSSFCPINMLLGATFEKH